MTDMRDKESQQVSKREANYMARLYVLPMFVYVTFLLRCSLAPHVALFTDRSRRSTQCCQVVVPAETDQRELQSYIPHQDRT